VMIADHGESFSEHPESGRAHGDLLFESTAHLPLVGWRWSWRPRCRTGSG
jgi:hypothetical protein